MKTRRYRVSRFAAGCTFKDACDKHYSCKTLPRANEMFEKEREKLNGGYVVLHQGNLKLESYKIIRITGVEKTT